MAVRMQAIRSWENKRYEGNVQRGDVFDASESRARDLEVRGLATRFEGKAAPGNLHTQASQTARMPADSSLAPESPLSLRRDRPREKPISRPSKDLAATD